jgi:hypothetical protein
MYSSWYVLYVRLTCSWPVQDEKYIKLVFITKVIKLHGQQNIEFILKCCYRMLCTGSLSQSYKRFCFGALT